MRVLGLLMVAVLATIRKYLDGLVVKVDVQLY